MAGFLIFGVTPVIDEQSNQIPAKNKKQKTHKPPSYRKRTVTTYDNRVADEVTNRDFVVEVNRLHAQGQVSAKAKNNNTKTKTNRKTKP